MTTEYRVIRQLIDELDIIHEKHIESFERDLLPDLEKQCEERSRAVESLVKKVNQFVHNIGPKPDTDASEEGVASLMRRISLLLNQNRVLAEKVKNHRDMIAASLKRISTGKKHLHSYGSPAYLSNRPRVISYTVE